MIPPYLLYLKKQTENLCVLFALFIFNLLNSEVKNKLTPEGIKQMMNIYGNQFGDKSEWG